MTQANLSAPVTLDPRQTVTLQVKLFKADCEDGSVLAVIQHKDSNGNIIFTDSLKLTGVQVTNWIAAQETTILNRYMAQKGLTGTIS